MWELHVKGTTPYSYCTSRAYRSLPSKKVEGLGPLVSWDLSVWSSPSECASPTIQRHGGYANWSCLELEPNVCRCPFQPPQLTLMDERKSEKMKLYKWEMIDKWFRAEIMHEQLKIKQQFTKNNGLLD